MSKITKEPCPLCEYTDAECEHLGDYKHFWHCDECADDWLAVVGYECEVCPRSATPEVSRQCACDCDACYSCSYK